MGMSTRASAWLVAAAFVAWHGLAEGDVPPAPTDTANALSPPRAVDAGIVPYPPGASGAAVVVLELVVDRDGRVAELRLLEGEEPFTGITMAHAWTWHFDPARKNGEVVPARVRMRVDFKPPELAAALPRAPPPADPAVTEVTVVGRRPDPGELTLGRGEVRQLPGAFGDAFRAIEALPSATPLASGLPYFFIRGAPPGDTGYFIDGVRVPLLFHAAFGPSVIHPSLIDHVELFPGAAPVQYGRVAGGVLSATVPPPKDTPHAEGIVRAFDAGALAEAPFADGRGTALAAGRFSYSGLILSAISPIKLNYWDYQARVTWKLGTRDEIGIFAFGSHDNFAQVRDGVTDTIINAEFHRADIRYDHALPRGTLRVATTLGYGRSGNDNNDIRDLTLVVRAALEDRLTRTATVRAGVDVTFDRFDLLGATPTDVYDKDVTAVLYPPHLDAAMGGYADVVWLLGPRVQVVPGIRADLFTSHRYDDVPSELRALSRTLGPGESPLSATTTSVLPAIDPRISARIDVARNLAVVSTFAVAQEPAAYVVTIPALTFTEPNPTLQTAIQMSQGVLLGLPEGLSVQATGFLHTYRDLTDLTATCPSIFGSNILLGNAPAVLNNLCLTRPVRGQAFGGELMVRRSISKKLTGWVSYTLSRSTREAPPTYYATERAPLDILAAFDRTHVVNVVVSYDLGRRWQTGARLVAYTGLPYSNTRDYVPVPPYNGERMPAFYRVDLRLEKSWQLAHPRATVAVVFEGMNVTLNKEVLGVHCAPGRGSSPGGVDPCTFQTLGPVTVPSVGVEGSFY
jgi:hypothetical protein